MVGNLEWLNLEAGKIAQKHIFSSEGLFFLFLKETNTVQHRRQYSEK